MILSFKFVDMCYSWLFWKVPVFFYIGFVTNMERNILTVYTRSIISLIFIDQRINIARYIGYVSVDSLTIDRIRVVSKIYYKCSQNSIASLFTVKDFILFWNSFCCLISHLFVIFHLCKFVLSMIHNKCENENRQKGAKPRSKFCLIALSKVGVHFE